MRDFTISKDLETGFFTFKIKVLESHGWEQYTFVGKPMSLVVNVYHWLGCEDAFWITRILGDLINICEDNSK